MFSWMSQVGQVGGAEEVGEGDVRLSSALRAHCPAQPACPESFFRSGVSFMSLQKEGGVDGARS